MCKKCGNNKCKGGCCQPSGATNDVAQLSAQVSSLTTVINNLTNSLGAFINGNPIMAFESAADKSLFNLTTGLGSGYLANWALCNGNSYPNPITGLSVATPNLLDKCLIAAGGTYPIDTVIGAATTTLTVPQLPAHTHVVTDPGHNHALIDPGHLHAIQDGVSGAGHSHATTAGTTTIPSFSTATDGDHYHDLVRNVQVGGYAGNTATNYYNTMTNATGAESGGAVNGASYMSNTGNADHAHTVTIPPFNTNVAVASNFTGVEVLTAQTGLSNSVIGVSGNQPSTTGITNQNTGAGAPISNMQPSYAVIYAMKIY